MVLGSPLCWDSPRGDADRHCLALGREPQGQTIYFVEMLMSKTSFCSGTSAVGILSSAARQDLHFSAT